MKGFLKKMRELTTRRWLLGTGWLVGWIVLGLSTDRIVWAESVSGPAALSAEQRAVCTQLQLDEEAIGRLLVKPLYEFTEAEVDLYLRYLQAAEPQLRQRIMHLARKNIGQPYELYLLGELPFEYYDPQPIYCLEKSDCLVFAEHTYAMALGRDWSNFMLLLQRLRYRDGHLGVVTRNHYTEADWNVSNRWLLKDITGEIAGDRAVTFKQKIDRAKFFKKRYQLTVDLPVEEHSDVFLPWEQIELAKPHLRDGDFVNVVRGIVRLDSPPNAIIAGSAWVGHVGLVAHGSDGQVHFIHSSKPKVREETLDAYIARGTKNLAQRDAAGKSRLLGFKFLRLEEQPLKNLQKIDGPEAPKVILPTGLDITHE